MSTFGDTNIEAANNQFSVGDRIIGKFTLGASGTVTQMSAYLSGGGSSEVVRAFIYSDNAGAPDALKAVSAEVTVGAGQAAGWVNFTISVALAPGDYWLGLWFGATGGAISFFRGIGTGVSSDGTGSYSSGGSPPDPFGSFDPLGSFQYSIYATYTASGSAPVNTVPPAVTGTDTVGSTLSCSTGTWTGDTSSGFAYQWQRDAAGNGVYSNIGGATASTRVLASADDGCHVRCVVTATGTGGSTAANSNATPIITFAIPSGGSVAVTGSAVVGQVLTATTSGWSPAPTSYAITWQRADDAAFTTNVVTVRGPTVQAGTTDPYTVQAADSGKYLRARATATDDGGTSGAVNSAPTAQVTTQPPVNVVPPSIAGTPIVGGLLTVTPGQWT